MKEVKEYFHKHPDRDRITYVDSPEAALPGAEALIICTEWQVFRNADLPADQIPVKKSRDF